MFRFVGGCRDGEVYTTISQSPFSGINHGMVGTHFRVASDAAVEALIRVSQLVLSKLCLRNNLKTALKTALLRRRQVRTRAARLSNPPTPSPTPPMPIAAIHLHPQDNICVATRSLPEGYELTAGPHHVTSRVR